MRSGSIDASHRHLGFVSVGIGQFFTLVYSDSGWDYQVILAGRDQFSVWIRLRTCDVLDRLDSHDKLLDVAGYGDFNFQRTRMT